MKRNGLTRWMWGSVLVIAVGCGGGGTPEEEAQPGDEAAGSGVSFSHDGDSMSFRISGEDGVVEINADDGSFEIRGPQGGIAMGGAQAKLPENMADDVPTHPDMKIVSVTTMGDQGTLMFQAELADDVDTVAKYFFDSAERSGWNELMKMQQAAGQAMSMAHYSKDKRILTITVTGDGRGSIVSVGVGEDDAG